MTDLYAPMFGSPMGPWLKAFAWTPIWTPDAGWVWLCRVWRRHVQKHQHLDGGADWWWQHIRFAPGHNEVVTKAEREIDRLRAIIRVNGLRCCVSHEEIDAMLDGKR